MPAPRPRSVLALDVGRRRVGLAGCDPLGITVTPLPALQRGPFPRELEVLEEIVRRRQVRALVVGVPLDAHQHPTLQVEHCRRFALRLVRGLEAAGVPLPVAWVNEHASTWAAAERFCLQGDRSGRLDSAAASLLLEQWLREGPEPDPVLPATIVSGNRAAAAAS